MKVVIFGLGNFGMPLAFHLSDTGNEVVAVDRNREKIDLIKDKVSHAVALDATNENAYGALPLKDTDVAVIGIAEDEGAAIMTTAIVKKLCKSKIIARSSSSVQDTIFEAMGIDLVIHPEQEFAERLTKIINLRGSIDNFKIEGEGDYLISEIEAGKDIIGKTVAGVNFRKEFGLNIITIRRKERYKNLLGRNAEKRVVIGMPKPDTVFKEEDVLVVFGKSSNIDKCLKELHPEESGS
jgi:trk system potassium uptake protein TrkA